MGTEEELLASLKQISLGEWATKRDALPERFEQALREAVKKLEPEAVAVSLSPPAMVRSEEELRAWIERVEREIREALKKGPVILR